MSSSWMRRIRFVQQVFTRVRPLDVDELGHLLGEQVLVLEARDGFVRRDPPVALPVDADEDVALRDVRAIEVARRVRASTHLEHHRREADALDRFLGGDALVRELLQRRAHEDAQPLIGCSDQRVHGLVTP